MNRFNQIWLLLDIIQKSAAVGPAAAWAANEAHKALADLKDVPAAPVEPELPLEPHGDDHG